MKNYVSLSKFSEGQSSSFRKVTVLGATGSIGLNTLDIVRQFPQKFRVESLSCRSSIERLSEQIKEFNPRLVCVDTRDQAKK